MTIRNARIFLRRGYHLPISGWKTGSQEVWPASVTHRHTISARVGGTEANIGFRFDEDALCIAHEVVRDDPVTPGYESSRHIRGKAERLKAQFIREPLVMEAWRVNCFLNREAKVNHVENDLQHSTDNSRPTWAADNQKQFAVAAEKCRGH